MEYSIIYSNYFKIENSTFAFRKKELFEITNIPTHKKLIEVSGCKGYWLCGKFYSLAKIKNLIITKPKEIDVSDLQWYQQINLDHVFNLTN